ncbi:hypothetical protein B0H63DRAFT_541096 [Podospora didyma]|uniref:Myocyte-specific enhancer factor 2d n=1 Tax=Podospora didyma TaxID=330526 RepID=A0AAE0NSM5_9PEZI|nr:hypothetical protein B0H63DRAFT_541096 [Podospora didyma]
MNREIPGYYYDSEKRKYFKIEATAPDQATWSASNHKRRQLEKRQLDARQERLALNALRIKPARLLNDALAGGLLHRELVGRPLVDAPVACWAQGLRQRASLRLWPSLAETAGAVSLMYIGNQDTKTGLGTAYAVLNEEALGSSYITGSDVDEINLRDGGIVHRRTKFSATILVPVHAPQLSSLTYHAPSHKILLTSRQPTRNVGIAYFSPTLSDFDDPSPAWLLGDTTLTHISIPVRDSQRSVNTCAAAPSGSSLTCVAGTSAGILQLHGDRLGWLTPPSQTRSSRHPASRGRGGYVKAFYKVASTPPYGEILSLDFLTPDVLLAGGRSNTLCVLDIRVPPDEWTTTVTHKSTVAHVKAVGDHEILAAGPRSAMAIYDLRYIQKHNNDAQAANYPPNRRRIGNAALPIVEFPEYSNSAHLQIGLDVLPASSGVGGRGIVAAAHDNGTVAVYSLQTGARVKCKAVDDIKLPGSNSVVKCLQWQTLPWDRNPSLFVGEGTAIKQYSFARGENGKEEEEKVRGDDGFWREMAT